MNTNLITITIPKAEWDAVQAMAEHERRLMKAVGIGDQRLIESEHDKWVQSHGTFSYLAEAGGFAGHSDSVVSSSLEIENMKTK